jgi:hypothetical protein
LDSIPLYWYPIIDLTLSPLLCMEVLFVALVFLFQNKHRTLLYILLIFSFELFTWGRPLGRKGNSGSKLNYYNLDKCVQIPLPKNNRKPLFYLSHQNGVGFLTQSGFKDKVIILGSLSTIFYG